LNVRARLTLALTGFIGLTVAGTVLLVRVSGDSPRTATGGVPAASVVAAAPPATLAMNAAPEPAKPPTVSAAGQPIAENPYAEEGIFPRDGYTLDVPLEKVVEPSGQVTWQPKGMKGAGPPSAALAAEFHRKGQNYGWSGGYPLPSNWDHDNESEALGMQTFDHLPADIVSGKNPASMMQTSKPVHAPKGHHPPEGLPR